MADYATESARKLLQELKMTAGDYAAFALAARKKYTSLMHDQEPEVRKIFIRAGDQVSKEIRNLRNRGFGSQLNDRYLEPLMKTLRETNIPQSLRERMNQYIIKGVDAGTGYSFDITKLHISSAKIPIEPMERMIFRTNKQAVDAMWARSENGLMLSDRIWQKGIKARYSMTEIIQDGIKNGEDPVKTARFLEQYVRRGKKTLSGDYPEMMERMGSRIPSDLSYEALRLVRTETAAAFGEGTIAAARVSPSYSGMKWVLSGAHPKPDICDELAGADHGMGRGVWPVGEEPRMPAHPNCLCILISVHEDVDFFMQRLNRWNTAPQTEPQLEKWFNDYFEGESGPKVHFTNKGAGGNREPSLAEQAKSYISKGKTSTEEDIRALGSLVQTEVEKSLSSLRSQRDQIKGELKELQKVVLKTPNVGSAIINEYNEIYKSLIKLENDLKAQRPEEIIKALSTIRPMGNQGEQLWSRFSDKRVVDAVNKTNGFYPSSWWEASNDSSLKGIIVERGYYMRGLPSTIALSAGGLERVAIHELGHRFEHVVPKLVELEKDFYRRRTAGESLQWLGAGYAETEKTRFDQFINPYMGKDYGGVAYEILSMGFEGMFGGSYDLTSDVDFEIFILGVLAGL